MIIAIDGPAASGKGTLAKRIAGHFKLPLLDTGALYRAVARDVLQRGFRINDVWAAVVAARTLDAKTLNDPALRWRGVGEAASIVARIPEVRAALFAFQVDFAKQPGGAVLDGRDIGTIICPNADVKIFVTASAQVRAERRYRELRERGEDITFEAVRTLISNRDQRDSDRSAAPLKQAADAYLLDTTNLDIEAAFNAAVGYIIATSGKQGDPR